MLYRLIICCASLYIIASHVITSGYIQHNTVINGDRVENNYFSNKCSRKILDKVIAIRGGKEQIKLKKKESDVKIQKNVISVINAEVVSFLKRIIPRSYWPRSWKTEKKPVSSKSMSKEHLEKSFAKGDSNSRIQKAIISLKSNTCISNKTQVLLLSGDYYGPKKYHHSYHVIAESCSLFSNHQELRSFMSNPPENCKLAVGSNIRSWLISIKGASDTIYAGENFKLKIVFPKEYPSKPPSVYFLKPTPKHVHVYSNGDICLNLLGRDWRPTMTAQTLVISILSMLASAKEKKMPQDNAMHADAAPGQQQDNWMYHDDRC